MQMHGRFQVLEDGFFVFIGGEQVMEINAALSFNSQALLAGSQQQAPKYGGTVQGDAADVKAEGLQKQREPEKLGEFRDKKALEEATDVKIGPDIRFALRSRNPAFLQRILWGPITVSEYREVKYRLQEIREQRLSDLSLVSGNPFSENIQMVKEDGLDALPATGKAVDISV